MSELTLADLVDLPKLQSLTDNLLKSAGIMTGLVSTDGVVLAASGWQDICLNFHRKNPETQQLCNESDAYIAEHLSEGFVGYRCKLGLMDYACPIMVEGRHVATFGTGQFLHNPPDEAAFLDQARRYGFDEEAYLAALRNVPVVEESSVPNTLAFLSSLADMLAESGLHRLREVEAAALRKSAAVYQEAVKKAEGYNRSLLEAALDPLVTIGSDGKITDVNRATEIITGRTRAELVGSDFCDYFTEPERARAGYQLAFEKGAVENYPLEVRRGDGRTTPVLYNASVYMNEAGEIQGVFAAARDITERKEAERIIRAQAQEILDVSTPVVRLWDDVVLAPIVGTLDSSRTQNLMERLLERIVDTNSSFALVDITGVPTIDTQTAQHLIETIAAVRLLGAEVILTGVRPAIAQTLVHLRIDLSNVITRPSLAGGLRVALDLLNSRASGSGRQGAPDAR